MCQKCGETLYVCAGKEKCSNTSTSIWGSNPYTSDCPPCQGARHSGVITDEGGFFHIISCEKQPSFVGSTANGVTTADYGSYSAVKIEAVEGDPFDLIKECFNNGQFGYCIGKDCRNTGSIWGSNPYTFDSPMCNAARHASLTDPESGGFYEIKQLGYVDAYVGSTENGITTASYGSYKGVQLVGVEGNPFPGCGGSKKKSTKNIDFGNHEVFTCVQCGDRYIEIENDILKNACEFHPEPKYDKFPRCCGTYDPCQKGQHRSVHHCDYKYASFFTRVNAVMGYVDTHEMWASAKDFNLEEPSNTQIVNVAKLLRWKTRTNLIEEDLLLVQVGNMSGEKYWWHVYTSQELDTIGQSGNTEIFRNSESTSSYSLARWIINESSQVVGIHMEAKEKTSENPDSIDCLFSAFPLVLQSVNIISESGLPLSNPESAYVFPEIRKHGSLIGEKASRVTRSFPTQGVINMKAKHFKNPAANEKAQSPSSDNFTGKMVCVNMNKGGDDAEPIVIQSVSCDWRFIGEQEYKPVDRLECTKNFTLYPLESSHLQYKIILNDSTKCVSWFNRAWIGRDRPIRFRMNFTDVDGNTSFQVFEYVFTPPPQSKAEKDDVLFLHVDDFVKYDRHVIRGKIIYNPENIEGDVFTCVDTFKVADLNSFVYMAKRDQQFEQLIVDKEAEDGACHRKVWALIDANTNRVYAIKALIQNTHSAQMGYFALPLYGKVSTNVLPNHPAVEIATFPEFHILDGETKLPQDDDFDSTEKPISDASAQAFVRTLPLSSHTAQSLERLNASMEVMANSMAQFESIQKSISSLADSIEILVANVL